MTRLKSKAHEPAAPSRASPVYHHGDLRNALVATARHLLETRGLASITIRAACERVGVSTAAPYRHFRDRNDLLAAVLVGAFEELEQATRQAWANEPNPSIALVTLGATYLGFACDHPNTYRAMFGGALDKQAYPSLHEAGTRALAVLQQAVRAWYRSVPRQGTEQAEQDEAQISLIAWSMAHGISTLALDGMLEIARDDAQRLAKRLFTRVVDALSRQPRASTSSWERR